MEVVYIVGGASVGWLTDELIKIGARKRLEHEKLKESVRLKTLTNLTRHFRKILPKLLRLKGRAEPIKLLTILGSVATYLENSQIVYGAGVRAFYFIRTLNKTQLINFFQDSTIEKLKNYR